MQSTAELLPGPLLWLPLGPLQSRCAVRSNTCPLSHSLAPRSPSRALACAMHVHILTTTRAPHARAQTTGGGHRTLHPPLPPRPAALIFGPPRAAAALLPVQPTGGGTRQSGCLGWWREGGGAGGRDGGGGGRGVGVVAAGDGGGASRGNGDGERDAARVKVRVRVRCTLHTARCRPHARRFARRRPHHGRARRDGRGHHRCAVAAPSARAGRSRFRHPCRALAATLACHAERVHMCMLHVYTR